MAEAAPRQPPIRILEVEVINDAEDGAAPRARSGRLSFSQRLSSRRSRSTRSMRSSLSGPGGQQENNAFPGLEPVLKLLWSTLTLLGPRKLEPLLPRRYQSTRFYFDTDEPLVALTIDDCFVRGEPDSCWAAEVAELLRRHDAHATFFVCSKYLLGVEDAAAELVAAGHELGNHMEEDLNNFYPKLGEKEFAAALQRTTAALEAVEGVGKVRWFRAPQAILSRVMADVVERAGLKHALGDVYADDWAMRRSPSFASRTMLRQVQHGSVCITHMPERGFREHTLQSLSQLLDGLSARGIKCLTLSAMEAHVEERRHAGPVRVPMEDKLEGMQTHRGHGASALTSNSSSTEPPADLI